MLNIHDNIVEFTRGDTVKLTVNLRHNDGYPYKMQLGDTLTMTIRKSLDTPILAQVTSDSNTIQLTPEQTKQLEPGVCCYDVELRTQSGEVHTVVGITDMLRHNMRIWPEVTE